MIQQEKTRALKSARKLLLKIIVFKVMYSQCVVMSPSNKRGVRKEAALRSNAKQIKQSVSASEAVQTIKGSQGNRERLKKCVWEDNMEIAMDWHKANKTPQVSTLSGSNFQRPLMRCCSFNTHC